jgi:tellurite resistance protein TehA-like permease
MMRHSLRKLNVMTPIDCLAFIVFMFLLLLPVYIYRSDKFLKRVSAVLGFSVFLLTMGVIISFKNLTDHINKQLEAKMVSKLQQVKGKIVLRR